MNRADWDDFWLANARLYVECYHLSVIPLSWEKKPVVKWAEYQDRRPTLDELRAWPKGNLGIVTGCVSGLVVADCESLEDAKWFAENRGKSPTVVQTKRGFHFYFKTPDTRVMNGTKIAGRYDVRGEGGFVVAPPSRHSRGRYRWHRDLQPVEKLPAWNPEWRPVTNGGSAASEKSIRDGAAYIAKIKAVAGQGGHNETYRAACVLRASGMSEGEALLCLQEWNRTNAEPAWSDRELLHKIQSAFGKE